MIRTPDVLQLSFVYPSAHTHIHACAMHHVYMLKPTELNNHPKKYFLQKSNH